MKEAILANIEAKGSDCPILVDMSKVSVIWATIDELNNEFTLKVVVSGKLLSMPMNTKGEVLAKKEKLIKLWKRCLSSGIISTSDI